MLVMWEQDRPLSRAEILELTPNRLWQPSSIHIILNRLLEKGAIEVDGFVKTGKNYGRTYSPTISDVEYVAMQIKRAILHIKPEPKAIARALASLVSDDEIDIVLKELEVYKKTKT